MANIIRIGKGKLPKRVQKTYTTLVRPELVPVRIDHKTVIFINKGEDAEKARSQFIEKVNEQRLVSFLS